jgi:hypothetical protein
MFFPSRRWKSRHTRGSRSDDSLLLPITHYLKEKQFLTLNKFKDGKYHTWSTWEVFFVSGAAGWLSWQEVFLMKVLFWVLTPCRAEALKMETLCFSEMLVSTYESIQCHNPEEHHPQISEVFLVIGLTFVTVMNMKCKVYWYCVRIFPSKEAEWLLTSQGLYSMELVKHQENQVGDGRIVFKYWMSQSSS